MAGASTVKFIQNDCISVVMNDFEITKIAEICFTAPV